MPVHDVEMQPVRARLVDAAVSLANRPKLAASREAAIIIGERLRESR